MFLKTEKITLIEILLLNIKTVNGFYGYHCMYTPNYFETRKLWNDPLLVLYEYKLKYKCIEIQNCILRF